MSTLNQYYETEGDLRERRNRRLAYTLFTISMLVSSIICGAILFATLAPPEGRRLVGEQSEFVAGDVAQVAVDRLELSQLLPNTPIWSEDIIFMVRMPDNSLRAYLALDPVSGCKLNWRDDRFYDDCSGTAYSLTGRNQSQATTLESSPTQMIELPVELEGSQVFILDRRLIRDRR
jgi:hypothetical protein